MNKKTGSTYKRAAAVLLAVVMAAPLTSSLPPAIQKNPLATFSAQAQRRSRARDYSQAELSRLVTATRRGQIISNPNNDFFEMRGEDRKVYRVLARENVSLRNFRNNDFVEVSGRIDGDIIIAHGIQKISGSSGSTLPGRQEILRGTVITNPMGNSFTVRSQGRTHQVIIEGRKPFSLRPGSEVEIWGVPRNGHFYASEVRVIDDRGNDWQNLNERRLQGTVIDGDARHLFRLRLDDGRIVQVSSTDRSASRVSRNNYVEVRGRWDSQRGNNAIFRAESVRVLNRTSPGGSDYRQGTPVDFVGEVIRTSNTGRNNWILTVRSNRETYNVHSQRNFQIGTRLRVRGTLRAGTVTATSIEISRPLR